jgi:hypothetical protein
MTMRAYTPVLPPEAWIIEELERLRREPELERPALPLPENRPEVPREAPEAPVDPRPEQAPPGSTVIVIDL